MTKSNTEVVGSSTLQEIREELECASRSDARVLISGDDRVQKEAIARLIHERGSRCSGPFVAINCSDPETFLESELRGERRLLQRASTGTLFLDNAAQMSLQTQGELMGFLENATDVRMIAATEKNLYEEMLAGRFREDLYYRLNVIHIVCTPSKHPLTIHQGLVSSDQSDLGQAV